MRLAAIVTLLLGFAGLAPLAPAQATAAASAPGSPVVSTVRSLEQRQSRNLIGAAEEMPAEKYTYRPTPEQMTFAHLVMHIAESNNSLCARIAGEKPSEVKLSETDSKDVLSKSLKESFTYCEQVLAKADDSELAQPVVLFGGRTGTKAAALIYLAADWADHYSAAAMYLRLNGMLPPSAKK